MTRLAAIALLLSLPASATDRVSLNRCEATLGVCYRVCKDSGLAPPICNTKCSTPLCGFSWNMSYGDFLDFMIEEHAAPGIPGLAKWK
jgi:hypothetical protein